MGRAEKKRARQERLVREIGKNPFLKDEELAKKLKVSVATIRLDRTELGIREYRERIRDVAEHSADGTGDCGEVLDFNLFHDGISILNTLDAAVFEDSTVVKGQAMYAYAENLALSVINAKSALIRVANIKYLREVNRGDRLVAKYEVMRVKNSEYVVWVRIKKDMSEMFRAKFNLSVTDEREI
ncbi:MAG: transcription factor FapR [Clostridia bacterium]|nr:transcription factor FapR [Clostridia bacterium]